jgi:hypothetical protein
MDLTVNRHESVKSGERTGATSRISTISSRAKQGLSAPSVLISWKSRLMPGLTAAGVICQIRESGQTDLA